MPLTALVASEDLFAFIHCETFKCYITLILTMFLGHEIVFSYLRFEALTAKILIVVLWFVTLRGLAGVYEGSG